MSMIFKGTPDTDSDRNSIVGREFRRERTSRDSRARTEIVALPTSLINLYCASDRLYVCLKQVFLYVGEKIVNNASSTCDQ